MKTGDVMTPRPLVASPGERPREIQRLMEAAKVHHIPLVDDGRVVGLWVATREGPLVLLGPEQVHETTPDVDAEATMSALLGDHEAAVVWDESGEPAGVVTRTDALNVLRSAFTQGLGRRTLRPVVLRLIGPAGAGKTTLLVRTVERMRGFRVGVIQGNAPAAGEPGERTLAGAPLVDAPNAHFRKGFHEALRQMAGVELVAVEDRDGPPVLSDRGLGETVRVLVVTPADALEIPEDSLAEADAVVVTKLDRAPPELAPERLARDLCRRHPGLLVVGVAAGIDDRGLDDWQHWLEGKILSRRP
ncbi:MAG TPA: CBS domain-containing protein [Miltoncostaeaceae bacterium]|nr:CBS domain-containing protein [Miltoncostaeaceae bacterium]